MCIMYRYILFTSGVSFCFFLAGHPLSSPTFPISLLLLIATEAILRPGVTCHFFPKYKHRMF